MFLARKSSEDEAWQHSRTYYVNWQKETFFYTREEAGQADSDVRSGVLKLNILWWSYLPSGKLLLPGFQRRKLMRPQRGWRPGAIPSSITTVPTLSKCFREWFYWGDYIGALCTRLAERGRLPDTEEKHPEIQLGRMHVLQHEHWKLNRRQNISFFKFNCRRYAGMYHHLIYFM